ncbi:hypothetical protein [Romboutsia lituseburensis]|uniref:hypothetical protein n=1 Tax=Romboutsia lituseburensis TaxID=1537 RepID=UPI00215ADF5C|nr:hypothetical protein [Romboutsia lituseburensis]MCR8743953.1 hypothetical protein [Romboutsia lituseburensis]
MPVVQLGVIKHSESNNSNFGYLVSEEKVNELNLPLKLNVKNIKSESCLHTIKIVSDELTLNQDIIFRDVIQYAQSKGLEICGDIIGKILVVDVYKPAKLQTYIELWIPIKLL